ncbi:hypothetical protein [Flavobacterium sp.]|uniref:hypothetical protein n=1 Tax=Flavobacterium sp. TaxID=239 RepID=UPI00403434CF
MRSLSLVRSALICALFCLFSCKESQEKESVTSTSTDSVPTVDTRPEEQALPVNDSVSTSDPISSIKGEFTRINAAKLTKKSYTYQCDELMKIDYYYEGKNVVKAIVDYGTVGDHYQRSEFYYKDGKLFFFYDFVEGGPACEGCDMNLEQRYYVKDDLVIRYIKNGATEKCKNCSFSQISTPYRALKAATTQDFKTAFCS